MLDDLLHRRALIVLGKGGVGRTSIAAALAIRAVQSGRRVLAMETDSHAPLAQLFGCDPKFTPTEAAPNLDVMVLDGARSLEEYLRLIVPRAALLGAVFSSRFYKYFVDAAPGLRELMMLGKLCHEIGARRAKWDLIVLDAPATGQALGLLRMPLAADQTFKQSLVGREARHIAATLRDTSRCAIVHVTIPEPLATTETLETQAALADLGYPIGAVLLNRFIDARFSAGDVGRLMRHKTLVSDRRRAASLAILARNQLRRAAESRRARAALRGRTPAPVIELPDHPDLTGIDLARALSTELASQLASRSRQLRSI